ncbi:BTAD domain-containing putative transcriptional regulator [Nakamurella sp.]|uniref:BTAD domain-containing putative transcriptional regulator n=1 Tax=Nakamurella sp. TaxID=1869182 RepID=UPI003B3AC8F1
MLSLRVLGALDATGDPDRPAPDLGGPRQRSVLALLLVARGQVVSVDRLVEDLWNGEAPPRAIGALQAYVSHLRRALEPDRAPRTPATILVSEPPGYAIRVPPDAVDAWQFEALIRRAAEPGGEAGARALLQQALDLWRGPAYAEFQGEAWASTEAGRLDSLRTVARERWCEAVLRDGDAAEAVVAAEVLTREFPLREEGWRLLAMSLYATGRQADALAALRRARSLLADELGMDPGPALIQVEADVLAQRLVVPVTPRRAATGTPGAAPAEADGVPARPGAAPAPGTRAGRPVTPGAAADRGPASPARATAETVPGSAAPTTPAAPGRAGPAATGGAGGPGPATAGGAPGPGDPGAPARHDGGDRHGPGMVGREAELATLRSAAAQVTDRADRRVALVAGEPGAGKSTLVERFVRDLRGDGWRVVVGRCPESDGAPPAWAWVEVVRALAAEVDPGPRRAALAPLLDELVRTSGESDASCGRFLLSRALIDYLTAATGPAPIAVVLDDLHRGDSETLALLDTVAAATGGVPLLLIAAYRPAEVPDGLRDVFAGLAALPPVRLTLGGLNRTDAERLIGSVAGVRPDPDVVAALVDRTAGNPFYLAESARLLASEGGLVAVSKVPEGVRDVLRRRFARLPELTVSILRLAAVIGRDVDVDVLIQAAEVGEDAVVDALEAGVLAGLLTEPDAGTVRFAHVLVRDTLYADAPKLRRSRWHGRIAEAVLSVRPDDAAALAHHYHQAAATATARNAVDAAGRAAEMAQSRYAHETAADLYVQALHDLDRVPAGQARPDPRRAADPGTDPHLAERVDLLARLSRAQLAAGATRDSLAARRQAMRLADAAGRSDLLIRAITAKDLPTPWMTRPYGTVDDELIALIERALTSTDPVPDPATRCRLLYSLIIEVADRDRSVRLAREGERLAREVGDPGLIGLVLHGWVSSVDVEVGIDRVREVGRELVQIGEGPGLAVFALVGHHSLARAACVHGDAAAMAEHVERVAELVEKFRWSQAAALVAMMRGTMSHLTGRLADAETHYRTATEKLMSSGAFDAAGIGLLALLTVRVTDHRVAELAEVLGQIDTSDDALVADLRALPLLALGRRDEAARGRHDLPPVPYNFFRSLLLTFRGKVASDLADPVEAARVDLELRAYRGQVGGGGTGSFVAGPVDTVLGDLALVLGRPDEARDLWRSGLALAERCGNPWWAAEARQRLGVAAPG